MNIGHPQPDYRRNWLRDTLVLSSRSPELIDRPQARRTREDQASQVTRTNLPAYLQDTAMFHSVFGYQFI